jgi:alpha-L-fucosidase
MLGDLMWLNKSLFIFFIVLFLPLIISNSCNNNNQKIEQFKPTWNSLGQHTIPEWFKDAKFGIYTHWGGYSVPAKGPNGSWYPHNMYKKDTEQYQYHIENYGDPSEFGYKDIIDLFKAEKFDAEEWAELFKKSGAKFAGPVAEHHDGFSMWKSNLTTWDSFEKGPKRDVVGELEKAIKKRGMKFITTFHHATHWAYYPHWIKEFDTSNPKYSDLYGPMHDQDKEWPEWYKIEPDDIAFMSEKPSKEFLNLWFNKLKEVIDNYQPDLIWFDGSLDRITETYNKKFFAYYFNHAAKHGKEVEVLFKGWDVPPNVAVNDLELGRESEITRHIWITDTSVDDMGAWSYAKEAGYKSVNTLVDNLVDRVSKNGLLLLNVGPKADGTIPEIAKERLLGIGKWLEVNGEAIYGTRAWILYGEGPSDMDEGGAYSEFEGGTETFYGSKDIRFTVKDNKLYATFLDWPGEKAKIYSLRRFEEELSIHWEADEIKRISMLGYEDELDWKISDDALVIETPEQKPCEHAFVFKIERNSEPEY